MTVDSPDTHHYAAATGRGLEPCGHYHRTEGGADRCRLRFNEEYWAGTDEGYVTAHAPPGVNADGSDGVDACDCEQR